MTTIPAGRINSFGMPGPPGPPGPAGPSGPDMLSGHVFNVALCSSVAEAFAQANAAHGTVFIPPGQYNVGSEPLEITAQGVRVIGCGDDSRLNFTGECAIRITNGVHVSLEHFQVRGSNASGQNGIEFQTSSQRCRVRDCYVEAVTLGKGIFANGIAISLHLDGNVVGACQDAIVINGPAGCLVERNFSNYWAVHGVYLYSVNDDVGNRANWVRQNFLHGNGGTAQAASSVRAAIRVRRVSSSQIEENYIERVLEGDGAELGHGIWIDGTGSVLTQANGVIRNYFGPGTTGDLIKIDSIASHTCVMGNNIPTGDTLRDDGLYTQFPIQHLGTIEQLVGTSTTRAGWIGLGPSGVVQLHS